MKGFHIRWLHAVCLVALCATEAFAEERTGHAYASGTASLMWTLTQRADQNGGRLESEEIAEYPVATLDAMVRYADAIVIATINDATPILVDSGTQLLTDYRTTVDRVLLGRTIHQGSTLTVDRPGGAPPIGGRSFVVTGGGFPPFETGEQYVLFLHRSELDASKYEPLRGGASAFRVAKGIVT